jgi:predicted GNAT family acetyltransferase
MTSRPLHVTIHNRDDASFDVYYVDHLCVDTMYRKRGIASQIIQTHHYNQRHHNRKIAVSLFKREDVLTGIVPLCVYSTYGFDMETWRKPIDLVSYIALVECGKTNIHILLDFLQEQTSWFDICIIPEVSNIVNLIATKNIFIYMIVIDNKVKCAYFFRKLCTFIRDKCEAIGCFASINNYDNDVFIHGYKVALWNICEKEGCSFAVVENISHNHILINNLKIKTKPSIESPTAYFFYNFAYHTFSSQRTLILH